MAEVGPQLHRLAQFRRRIAHHDAPKAILEQINVVAAVAADKHLHRCHQQRVDQELDRGPIATALRDDVEIDIVRIDQFDR